MKIIIEKEFEEYLYKCVTAIDDYVGEEYVFGYDSKTFDNPTEALQWIYNCDDYWSNTIYTNDKKFVEENPNIAEYKELDMIKS